VRLLKPIFTLPPWAQPRSGASEAEGEGPAHGRFGYGYGQGTAPSLDQDVRRALYGTPFDSAAASGRGAAGVMSIDAGHVAPAPQPAPGNTHFLTAAADGSARLWAIRWSSAAASGVLAQSRGLYAPLEPRAASDALALVPCFDLPTDGLPVCAAASAAWPLPAALACAARGVRPPLRSLVATGNVEGAVSLWELCIEEQDCLAPAHATGAAAAPTPVAVRLVGLIASRRVDPLADMAISTPLLPSAAAPQGAGESAADPYVLATACVDGTLQLYRLHGTAAGAGTGAADDNGDGARWGAITAELQASVGEEERDSTEPLQASVFDSRMQQPSRTAVEALGQSLPQGLRGLASPAQAAAERPGISAITAVALGALHKAFIACAFNDSARRFFDDIDLCYPLADDAMSVGALMACTGGGEVMLWPKFALPGSPGAVEEDMMVDAAQSEAEQQRPSAPLVMEAPATVGDAGLAPADSDSLGADGRDLAAATVDREKVNVYEQEVANPTALTAEDGSFGADGGNTEEAFLDYDDTAANRSGGHNVAVAAEADAVSNAHEAGMSLTASARRVLSDTQASLRRRQEIEAQRAAAARKATVGAAPFLPTGPASVSSTSAAGMVPPSDAQRAFLRALAADMVKDAFARVPAAGDDARSTGSRSSSLSGRRRPEAAKLLSASYMTGGDPTTDPLGMQNTSAASGHGPSYVDVSDPTGPDLSFGSVASRQKAAVRSLSRPRSRKGSVCSTTAGAHIASAAEAGNGIATSDDGLSYASLHPSFRNPARVTAFAMDDSARMNRAARTVARDAVGMDGIACDDHPEATSIYGRAAACEALNSHHLVAPALSSSAALAAEIERLEALQFDEHAELLVILKEKNVCDVKVIQELTQRVQERTLATSAPMDVSIDFLVNAAYNNATVDVAEAAAPPLPRATGASPNTTHARIAALQSLDTSQSGSIANLEGQKLGLAAVNDFSFAYVPRQAGVNASFSQGATNVPVNAPVSFAPTQKVYSPTKAVLALAAKREESTKARERLLAVKREKARASESKGDRVSAEDMIRFHFGLRR
jgi:hypothetical protein